MQDTLEIGLKIGQIAPEFELEDHERHLRRVQCLMGERGLLLGFVNNIWEPASIRRILFMQRHIHRFENAGLQAALVIADQQYTLYSFYMSSPMTVAIPLLADPFQSVHDLFNMPYPGLLLLDKNAILRHKWLMPDERVWPKTQDIIVEASKL